ncbi:Uncharacterised protein [Vibrio cholerae]|nr:Uncharacterised protein [Vibrio cholerae]
MGLRTAKEHQCDAQCNDPAAFGQLRRFTSVFIE